VQHAVTVASRSNATHCAPVRFSVRNGRTSRLNQSLLHAEGYARVDALDFTLSRGFRSARPHPSTAHADQGTDDPCESMQRCVRFVPDIARKLIEEYATEG